ncbi:drug/metabolite transporter (DMT)-like permease [Amycolatopsis bartoniae]|uniref:DMT family transporter n=1 Tax=Amycolatopsis bartoniae TaxID=941986 RepID=A0A8H9IZK5_9PSEU|nr:DMT family transporter [Amycolatopsis bartoniae]MBB2937560.1 drug/metabolite transporter (DMT)-like permease [Amycolatopsis bartoniae]TVT05929.1 hypothetical protein FNH07_22135 [Amycolatopsis bartoniae]GHF82176.1 hypothetical protein GCM10017566_65380 [Amycolatopsis bartoniae]
MVLGVVCAVLAAGANAAGSVLQRMGARRKPGLLELVRKPTWLSGVLATFAGLVLQTVALANAPIVLVQSLLIGELGFVLLLASVVFRTRLPPLEWVALAGLGAGMALLLVSLSAQGGDSLHVPAGVWLLGVGATFAAVGVLLAVGSKRHHLKRAACFGAAAGIWFGFTAVLVDGIGATFTNGFSGVFSAWQTYAMLVCGPAGFLLLQQALRAGPLVASQPGLTLANPLAALGWGLLAFHEDVRGGAWLAGDLTALVLITACTVQLARSSLLDGRDEVSRSPRSAPASPR